MRTPHSFLKTCAVVASRRPSFREHWDIHLLMGAIQVAGFVLALIVPSCPSSKRSSNSDNL